LTSALDGGEWSASRPDRFTSRERDPDAHWLGGWMGPRAGMEAVVRTRTPDHPARKGKSDRLFVLYAGLVDQEQYLCSSY